MLAMAKNGYCVRSVDLTPPGVLQEAQDDCEEQVSACSI